MGVAGGPWERTGGVRGVRGGAGGAELMLVGLAWGGGESAGLMAMPAGCLAAHRGSEEDRACVRMGCLCDGAQGLHRGAGAACKGAHPATQHGHQSTPCLLCTHHVVVERPLAPLKSAAAGDQGFFVAAAEHANEALLAVRCRWCSCMMMGRAADGESGIAPRRAPRSPNMVQPR